ncbi:hypothetical protein M413DRAFT_439000 [Hebeloma cylindrosporum]|uniref:DUF6593 domain-containing protein n=1 Tax=Hebeloma cylindrosporum TaxID=76867 RepID=A0A0C2Z9P8_HEBCY|nr:hypothetical protein M413DRAFT_439000 [Hebeloma cylindrosporum h7]
MSIHLTLSSKKPWDSIYRTQEGQVIYKVESVAPILGTRTMKISKTIPSFSDNRITAKGRQAQYLRDSFAHLATVEYHKIRSSRIRMGNLDVATDDYFRREGWSLINSGRKRVFTAPDGREYLWKLGKNNCKLFANDSERTPVARFHQRRLGIIRATRPASLEIFPTGTDIVDLIVITGAYMEKLRYEKNSTAANSDGGIPATVDSTSPF